MHAHDETVVFNNVHVFDYDPRAINRRLKDNSKKR